MAWTTTENEKFERALAMYDGDTPGRWERVAAVVGGGKTADDVKGHYDRLVEDLGRIESGHYGYPNSFNSKGNNNSNNRASRPQT